MTDKKQREDSITFNDLDKENKRDESAKQNTKNKKQENVEVILIASQYVIVKNNNGHNVRVYVEYEGKIGDKIKL